MNDLFWVIVLYNQVPTTPPTLRILDKIFKIHNETIHHILVYDNSLNPIINSADILNCKNVILDYIHNPLNPGIAEAYNYALNKANTLNKKWLILLDQDTILNENFVLNIESSLDLISSNSNIVAIIPKVLDGLKVVSPTKFVFGVFTSKIYNIQKGNQIGHISAINSGSCLSVKFLTSLNGFNPNFPLDMLDHWLFYKIFTLNKIILLNNNVIKHSLSVSNAPMSVNRYHMAIKSEKYLFCDIANMTFNYKILLLLRFFKQILFLRFKLARLTLLSFFNLFKFY
jgi:GT2 family glycosyltransferase